MLRDSSNAASLAIEALIEGRDFTFTSRSVFVWDLASHLQVMSPADCYQAVKNLIAHPAYPIIIKDRLDLEILVNKLHHQSAVDLLIANVSDNDEEFNRLIDDFVHYEFITNKKLAEATLARFIARPWQCAALHLDGGVSWFAMYIPIACSQLFIRAYFDGQSSQYKTEIINNFIQSLLRRRFEQEEIVELMEGIFQDQDIVSKLEFDYPTLAQIAKRVPSYASQLVKTIAERGILIGGKKNSFMHAALDNSALHDLDMWLMAGDDPNYYTQHYIGNRISLYLHVTAFGVINPDLNRFRFKLMCFGAYPLQGNAILSVLLSQPASSERDEMVTELVSLGVETSNISKALQIIYKQRPEMVTWVKSRGISDNESTNNEALLKIITQFEFKLQIKLTEQKNIGRNIFFNLCIALALTKPDHPPFPLTFETLMLVLRLCGLEKTTAECRRLRDTCFEKSELLKELIKTPGGINVCQRFRSDGTYSFHFFKSATTAVLDYQRLPSKLVKKQRRSLVEVLKKQPYSKATLQTLQNFKNIHAETCLASHESVLGVVNKRLLHNLIDNSGLYKEVRETNECMNEFLVVDEECASINPWASYNNN